MTQKIRHSRCLKIYFKLQKDETFTNILFLVTLCPQLLDSVKTAKTAKKTGSNSVLKKELCYNLTC